MIKKYFYKIYEKILGKFDDNDGKLLRQYYKKRFGVDVGKHSYGMDFSNIAQGTKIGAFCSIASGVKIGLMNHPILFYIIKIGGLLKKISILRLRWGVILVMMYG